MSGGGGGGGGGQLSYLALGFATIDPSVITWGVTIDPGSIVGGSIVGGLIVRGSIVALPWNKKFSALTNPTIFNFIAAVQIRKSLNG